VTFVDWCLGGIRGRDGLAYGLAQIGGGIVGAIVANLMFALPAVEISSKVRWGPGLWLAEVVATFGLLLVIFGGVRSGRAETVPFGVGAYIGGAYWFTSSTSFANPAVTIGRLLSNTFAGIAPGCAVPFIAAQLAGSLVAVVVVRALYPAAAEVAARVIVTHPARVPATAAEGDPPNQEK
jgi:glycerol uptake facilitator-like aquaporin